MPDSDAKLRAIEGLAADEPVFEDIPFETEPGEASAEIAIESDLTEAPQNFKPTKKPFRAANNFASSESQEYKRDRELLLQALNLQKEGTHQHCIFCEDSDKAMSVYTHDGIWMFKCFACDSKGTVFDALMTQTQKEFKDVLEDLRQRTGNRHRTYTGAKTPYPEDTRKKTKQEVEEPVVDMERAKAFVDMAHAEFLKNRAAFEKYAVGKRGINLDTIKQYQLGFLENKTVELPTGKPGKTYRKLIQAAWVLPITSKNGVLRAVRFHHEIVPTKFDGSRGGKNAWLCFGTEPKDDPRHGYSTLWPHPELQPDPIKILNYDTDVSWWINRIPDGSQLKTDWNNRLRYALDCIALDSKCTAEDLGADQQEAALQETFRDMRRDIQKVVLRQHDDFGIPNRCRRWIALAPGELKALALISSGLMATAPTSGESAQPTRKMLAALSGLSVAIVYDQDASIQPKTGAIKNAGVQFVHNWATALKGMARDVRFFTGKRKE